MEEIESVGISEEEIDSGISEVEFGSHEASVEETESDDQIDNQIKIIIVTGHPACNKSLIATYVGGWLKCPILCLESIIRELRPADESTVLIPTHPEYKELVTVGIRILFQQAKRHLRTAFMHHHCCIVLEFPLSSCLQLEQLVKQVNDVRNKILVEKVIIIKCKPQNKIQWEKEFKDDGYDIEAQENPYRMKNWNDVLRAIKQNYEITSSDFQNSKISDVVSMLETDPFVDICLPYSETRSNTQPPFYEALYYMLFIREKVGCFLTMRQWAEFRHTYVLSSCHICSMGMGSAYHDITYEMPVEGGHWIEDGCGVCGDRVSDRGYFCRYCPLALHKACAEMKEKSPMSFQPFRNKNEIPEKYGCKSCKEEGKDFSLKCNACLFETHLKCKVWPTIAIHPLHPHFLQTQIYSKLSCRYERCAACGGSVDEGVAYFCNFCGLVFGFSCATQLPMEVIHEHVGYKHPMKLHPSSTYEELDNHICHVCWEDRDPNRWYYYCDECDFAAHVYCMDGPEGYSYH